MCAPSKETTAMKTRNSITTLLVLSCLAGPAVAQVSYNAPRTTLTSSLTTAMPSPEPGALQAEPRERSKNRGFYLKGFGGLGLLEDAEILFDDGAGSVTDGDGEFESGYMAGAALGYRLNDHLRLEAEYAYRTNDLDSFQSGGSVLGNGGDFASTAVLFNVLYDFDTDWRFDPYVGVGFGTATEIDIDLEGPGFTGEASFSSDSPAAQYMVGAQGALTQSLDLFVEGRFFRAFDPDMSGEGNLGNVESEYGHFSLLFGLSFGF